MNMDFNVKKIVKDAGAALSRVVQVITFFFIAFIKKIVSFFNAADDRRKTGDFRENGIRCSF